MNWNINYNNSLKCPSCGGENLHHETVDVYFRKGEDSIDGVFVRCDSTSVKPITGEGNPSNRRDGLVIKFWCETCDDKPQLAIIQHKGTTYGEWRGNGGGGE